MIKDENSITLLKYQTLKFVFKLLKHQTLKFVLIFKKSNNKKIVNKKKINADVLPF